MTDEAKGRELDPDRLTMTAAAIERQGFKGAARILRRAGERIAELEAEVERLKLLQGPLSVEAQLLLDEAFGFETRTLPDRVRDLIAKVQELTK